MAKKMGKKNSDKKKVERFQENHCKCVLMFFLREKERINAIGSSMGIAKGKR